MRQVYNFFAVGEVLFEPGGERAKEEVIIDLRANIVELVSESLQAATIVVDGGVVLVTPKKLLLQKNTTLELIVDEEPVQFGPHVAGIVTVRHDRLEEVRRDGEEEPADDRSVDGGTIMELGDDLRPVHPPSDVYYTTCSCRLVLDLQARSFEGQ